MIDNPDAWKLQEKIDAMQEELDKLTKKEEKLEIPTGDIILLGNGKHRKGGPTTRLARTKVGRAFANEKQAETAEYYHRRFGVLLRCALEWNPEGWDGDRGYVVMVGAPVNEGYHIQSWTAHRTSATDVKFAERATADKAYKLLKQEGLL